LKNMLRAITVCVVFLNVLKRTKRMESKNDVIIVGGGIIGLACAHYLLKENASVRIIEKDVIGSGASHGNCGLLHFSGILPLCAPGIVRHEIYRAICGTSPLYIKPGLDIDRFLWLIKFASHCNKSHVSCATKAKHELLRYSKNLYAQFFKEASLSCDYEKKGLLLLFRDRQYFEKYAITNAKLKQYDFEARPLDTKDARAIEPSIHEDVVGAYYNEHDDHIRPEILIQSWKNHLVKKGLIIEEKCKVTNFETAHNKIRAVKTVKGRYQADHFIISTGAFTPEFNKQLKLSIPVQPGKGYSITMEKPDRSCEIPCLLYEKNMVVTPWKSGYRLGGTMEFSGFDKTLNKKRLARLLNGAGEYLNTSLENPILEEWAGFRPMTYDDLPIIDRSPDTKNLYIATGHGMLGLTMATGTGKAISDIITKGSAQISLAPFSLDRF